MEAELNDIGCCMGSSGPGHVHLVNQLYDANKAGNPVIVIASTIHTEKWGWTIFKRQDLNLYFKIARNMYFKRIHQNKP